MQGVADPVAAKERAVAVLARVAHHEAATMAFSDALWMMAVLFFAALLLVPLIKKPSAPSAAAAQEGH